MINSIPTSLMPITNLSPSVTNSARFAQSASSGAASSASSSIYDYADYLNDLQHEAAQDQMDFQASSAEDAMNFEAEQAKLNRDFQREMSNTAFQRAVSDLKAAGLNPVLAVGAQASTPQGSSASGFAAQGSQANYSNQNLAWDLTNLKVTSATKILQSVIGAVGDVFSSGNLSPLPVKNKIGF